MTKHSITWSALLLLASVAQATVPDAPEFGLLGGSHGQVARLNVTCDTDSVSPCLVKAIYTDLLGRPAGDGKFFNLPPGASGWLEINFSNLVSERGGRVDLRPVVTYFEGSGRAHFAVDMYDQFLRRTINFSSVHPARLIAGKPPKFPLVGMVSGQMLRLAIGAVVDPNERGVIDPNDKCRGAINFRTADGSVIDPNDKFALAPGEWKYFDLPAPKSLRFGQRVEFVPAVQVDPPAVASPMVACSASVQVIDMASGGTSLYIPRVVLDEPLW